MCGENPYPHTNGKWWAESYLGQVLNLPEHQFSHLYTGKTKLTLPTSRVTTRITHSRVCESPLDGTGLRHQLPLKCLFSVSLFTSSPHLIVLGKRFLPGDILQHQTKARHIHLEPTPTPMFSYPNLKMESDMQHAFQVINKLAKIQGLLIFPKRIPLDVWSWPQNIERF